uniref:C2H2-type domain-containing protein n=1 Tax=Otus sunia TaxID=257818 RepID=A0A8C8B6U7_9STRI
VTGEHTPRRSTFSAPHVGNASPTAPTCCSPMHPHRRETTQLLAQQEELPADPVGAKTLSFSSSHHEHPAAARKTTPGAGGEVGEQGGADTDGTRGWREQHPCSHEQAGGPPKQGTSKCPECGKIFRWSNSRRPSTDPRSNYREKKYKCEHCRKGFISRSKLTYHIRSHTGEKPYKCWDCGRGFSMRGNLLSHQRTHTKEKPFPCPTCGKCFSFRSNLLVHQSIHTKERPYACSYCGKTFREGHHLYFGQELAGDPSPHE